MKRIFAVALVLIGTPLEGYFYWYRFVEEGMQQHIAIAAGGGLILLLSVFVHLAKTNKKLYAPAVAIALFSVISTSAGQSFATLSERQLSSGIDVRRESALIARDSALAELRRLDREYESLSAQVSSSISTFEDRYTWQRTLATVDGQRKQNRERRDVERDKYDAAVASLATLSEATQTDIYTYYSSLFGLSAKWLQFVLHTILSCFLTLMTPTGVVLWPKREDHKPHVTKPRRRTSMPKPVVERPTESLDPLPDILSPRQAGEVLGISHVPLYHAMKLGELTPVSRHPIRFRKDDVKAWWKNHA